MLNYNIGNSAKIKGVALVIPFGERRCNRSSHWGYALFLFGVE